MMMADCGTPMTEAELIGVYKRNLTALDAHAVDVSMDDKENIRIILV